MTGRRPDHTFCSVDIGVTDVTKNSRLFAVTSTTCSTYYSSCCVFSTHRHQALQQSSTPSQCPRRFVILAQRKLCIGTSFETETYIFNANTRYQVHTYAVYSCVWRLWVVFQEHGGGALGIFKSPICTYNQAWTFSLSASPYCSFLSKRSG